jgi:hypothetical protein
LKNQVIERRPVLLDAFSDQETDLRRRSADLLNPQHDAWGLRVILYGESVVVWPAEELVGRVRNGLKTVYRPIEL